MSYNSSLNNDVVKTAIDDVFFQKFSGDEAPGYATAEDAMCFRQDTAEHQAVILDVFKGVGAWQQRAEEQDVPQGDPRIANQKTFTILNWAKSVDIPKNFFDDNMHGAYEKMVTNFAQRARTTRDRAAFSHYVNGFTSETTADGSYLFSASHTNLNGDTVSNILTGAGNALAEGSLATAIQTMWEMKSQDGEIDGFVPAFLLVPPALNKLAYEITESELKSGVGTNDLNWYSLKYGIVVKTSVFLGKAATGVSTADAQYYLGSRDHSVYRFVRQAVQTVLVGWETQRNNNYIYKGEFRETVGAMSYEGLVGYQGS